MVLGGKGGKKKGECGKAHSRKPPNRRAHVKHKVKGGKQNPKGGGGTKKAARKRDFISLQPSGRKAAPTCVICGMTSKDLDG